MVKHLNTKSKNTIYFKLYVLKMSKIVINKRISESLLFVNKMYRYSLSKSHINN